MPFADLTKVGLAIDEIEEVVEKKLALNRSEKTEVIFWLIKTL